ncbi:hypothetical protein B0H13DRAFT_2327063 [Mycena leptocephala]|nr:hypothetical protein B0H13DRAFT_2327063 [Mycena leptocephala]
MKYLANLTLLSAWVSLTSAFRQPDSAQTILSLAPGSQIRTTETCGNPAHAVPFYRSYHSARIDHWYTADVQRINQFVQVPRDSPWRALLVCATAGDNYYTISTAERDAALKNGYSFDDVSYPLTYIYPNQTCGSVPLFHLYHRSKQDNFYTTSDSERVDVISNRGYVDADVGVAGYVLPLGPSRRD